MQRLCKRAFTKLNHVRIACDIGRNATESDDRDALSLSLIDRFLPRIRWAFSSYIKLKLKLS